MSASFVVGIDLGTTNSSIAVVLDGTLTVIPVHGQPSMPSAVGLDPAGRLVIGQTAKNQSVSAPENTVLSVKRIMGTDHTVSLGGKPYRPEEISALILGELKREAEKHLGQPVTRAVITVPAFFNERQRQATQDAGRLAGLEVLRIINEPTAAALAYGAGQAPDTTHENLLVFDLGGGTFDVSVVRVENGIVEVRASHGDIHLGGDDFDEELAKLGEQRFRAQHGDAADFPPAAHRRLCAAMELAKIQLSDAPFATVREEFLTASGHLDTEIGRHDYERLIEPLLHKSLDCLQQSLTDAGLTASALDKVMLVGGATRTPLVGQLLESQLGIEPRHEINPDLVVAMGAAIQGAALAGQPAPAILIDISAHTYSTVALADRGIFGGELACFPLIRRGTPLPVTKSEAFFTVVDNQENVRIRVCQGEHPYPDDNLEIGNFLVEGLSKQPSGNPVVVQFRIDLNGLLTVTASEKLTSLAKSVTIDTAGQHRLNLDAARTNLAELFELQDAAEDALLEDDDDDDGDDEDDDGDDEFDDDAAEDANGEDGDVDGPTRGADSATLLASAKSLRQRTERLLAAGLPEADATAVREALAAISPAIETRDWPALRDHLDALSDLLFYLED